MQLSLPTGATPEAEGKPSGEGAEAAEAAEEKAWWSEYWEASRSWVMGGLPLVLYGLYKWQPWVRAQECIERSQPTDSSCRALSVHRL